MFRPLLATRVNSSFSFSPLFVDTSRPPCFVNRDSCVFARVDHSRDAFGKTWTNRSRFPGGMEQRSEIGQIGLPVERIISWRIAIFQKRIFAFSVISPEFGNIGHRRRVSIVAQRSYRDRASNFYNRTEGMKEGRMCEWKI